mgnify:CR=1 FL=1|jgi:Zn-dependent protease
MSIITIFFIVAIIFSAIIHEYMHAWMANYLGDPTAKNQGRLTLNPIVHIDPVLTILMPIVTMLLAGFPFGGAKPVPFNPYNLRDKQYGPAKVALAGPAANFVTAISFGLILRFFPMPSEMFATMLYIIVYVNVLLMVFNLMPIPPLDGSKVILPFLPANAQLMMMRMEQFGLFLVYGMIFLLFPVIAGIIEFIMRLIIG